MIWSEILVRMRVLDKEIKTNGKIGSRGKHQIMEHPHYEFINEWIRTSDIHI